VLLAALRCGGGAMRGASSAGASSTWASRPSPSASAGGGEPGGAAAPARAFAGEVRGVLRRRRAAQAKGSQKIADIGGLVATHPALGWGLALAIAGIAGLPPFLLFASEIPPAGQAAAQAPWLALPLGSAWWSRGGADHRAAGDVLRPPPTPDAAGALRMGGGKRRRRRRSGCTWRWRRSSLAIAGPAASRRRGCWDDPGGGSSDDVRPFPKDEKVIRPGLSPQGAARFERFLLPRSNGPRCPRRCRRADLALLALWAEPGLVHAAFLDEARRRAARSAPPAGGRYAALSPARPGAVRFERMIRDLWGLAPRARSISAPGSTTAAGPSPAPLSGAPRAIPAPSRRNRNSSPSRARASTRSRSARSMPA
jgi:hypothetical protein